MPGRLVPAPAEHAAVRAPHLAQLRRWAIATKHDERLARIGRLEEGIELRLPARDPHVHRRQNAAADGQEVRHEQRRSGRARRAQLLLDLGTVAMGSDRVRAKVLVTSAKSCSTLAARPAPVVPDLASMTAGA